MTQITINSKTYQLSEKADVFNTHIEDKERKSSVPVSYTREQVVEGVRTGDKTIIAFVQGRIEAGSPYFKEIIPTETDLENIKILEEAAAEVEQLRAVLKESGSHLDSALSKNKDLQVELVKAQTDCAGFESQLDEANKSIKALEAQLAKANEANKALDAENKALKKVGTAKSSDDKQGGV